MKFECIKITYIAISQSISKFTKEFEIYTQLTSLIYPCSFCMKGKWKAENIERAHEAKVQ